MAISSETIGRLLASGRNYISTIVGFIGGIGLMSVSQQKGVSDAFPVIGVWMAQMASKSATVTSQAAALKTAVADPKTSIPPEAAKNIVEAAKAV